MPNASSITSAGRCAGMSADPNWTEKRSPGPGSVLKAEEGATLAVAGFGLCGV